MNPHMATREVEGEANGIMIAAYSPLGAAGASWGTKGVIESQVLKEIAKSKGRSVALRWI